MDRYAGYSYRKILKGLRKAGFKIISQRGNHIKLRKVVPEGKLTVIVPRKKDIPPGVLRSIREMSGLDEEGFFELIR